MKLDDQALPLTRRQLEGAAQRDALEWAIRRALQEAEPVSAAFFEADGQVFQRAIDYSDVELAFYDVSCSRLPVQEANQLASSICTPMPFAGPLFKFALFRTRPGEFYGPFPTAFFGSLHDFVDFELEDQASNDYLEDASHTILRVFGAAVAPTTVLRCRVPFDIRSPLLIHVSEGEPVFASTTSEHRKLHRPRWGPCLPSYERYKPIHHCRSHQRKPQSAQSCGARTSY
jgi:hypothetical protein